MRRFIVYRDAVSRRPYSTTPIYDIDHIDRYADGGPTTAPNGEGLGVSDHHTLDLPGWTVTAIDGDAGIAVRWTTPTGHQYTSRPPPILGHGNTTDHQPSRQQPKPHWTAIEYERHRLPIQYTGKHHPRPDAA